MSELVALHHGSARYTGLLARLRADPWLVGRMWADAESTPDELDVPGTVWCVALVGGELAAWCAATPDGEVLRAHSNYEHPSHRGRGLYAAAYAQRQRDVVQRCGLPGVTYLFAQPIGLHEADGWVCTGVARRSEDGHEWWELRRPVSPT